MSEFTFTPPGTIQRNIYNFPARSACCKLDPAMIRRRVVRVLLDGDPTRDPSKIALFESTDAADFAEEDGDGIWDVLWDDDLDDAALVHTELAPPEIGEYLDANYFVQSPPEGDTGTRAKGCYKLGWDRTITPTPAWRAMDGDTVRVDWKIWEDSGTGFEELSTGFEDITIAPGASSVYQADWTDFPEPAAGTKQAIAYPGVWTFAFAEYAYAGRECFGS